MSKIIIAWEYEKEVIQVLRLKHLQQALVQQGHEVFLAGCTLPLIDPLSDENALLPFVPAPRIPPPSLHKPRIVIKIGGYSDRLALLGFGQLNSLYTLIKAWDTMFDLLKPDLLICDCAPLANLAAYERIPVIQFSDGMSLPPSHLADFPRLRPDAMPFTSSSRMLENIHIVQQKRKQRAPNFLPELLRAEYTFIDQLPALDPYYDFRNRSKTQIGTYNTLPTCHLNNLQQRYFAHLDLSYADIESVILGLNDLSKKGTFFLPDAPTSLAQLLETRGHTVLTQLASFSDILKDCAFVIHHGNTIVAEAALAAGIPQVTLPYHFESEWTCDTLSRLKVGLNVVPKLHPLSTTAEIVQLATQQSSVRDWATLRAQHLEQQQVTPLQPAILQACQSILT